MVQQSDIPNLIDGLWNANSTKTDATQMGTAQGAARREFLVVTGVVGGGGGQVPPPPCNSYAKVPNQYGPYAYCSLDKAVDAQAQKEKWMGLGSGWNRASSKQQASCCELGQNLILR